MYSFIILLAVLQINDIARRPAISRTIPRIPDPDGDEKPAISTFPDL